MVTMQMHLWQFVHKPDDHDLIVEDLSSSIADAKLEGNLLATGNLLPAYEDSS
jgi:hypothetical protein